MRERFGALRRRDSTGNVTKYWLSVSFAPDHCLKEHPTITIPRKPSISSLQPPQASPRDATLPSPRRTSGYIPGFDGILSGGESWVARRRASEASLKPGTAPSRETNGDYQQESKASEILEEEEEDTSGRNLQKADSHTTALGGKEPLLSDGQNAISGSANLSLDMNGSSAPGSHSSSMTSSLPTNITDYASIEWSYKDPSGQVQGDLSAF